MKGFFHQICAITIAVVAVFAVVAAGSTVGSTTARASAVRLGCGAVITTDSRLDADLTNCPDNGISIGADNVTLDLNGHTVGGDGVAAGSCLDEGICDRGISNDAGYDSVTIKGGAVRGFDVGVSVSGANDNRIQKISLANNSTFGVVVGDSNESLIDHNSSVGGVSGILMSGSSDNRIDHNSLAGSEGYAMPIFGSSYNRIRQNVLEGDQHGILLEESSTDNEIRGNRISHGGSIEIDHSSDNHVEENVLNNPADGILLGEAERTRVSNNSVTDAGVGFLEAGGFGILLDGADDNLVQGNVVIGGNGPALFVSSLESQGTSDRNVLSHNEANSRFSDGILVSGGATATLLERNTANGSGHDGIQVDAAGTTVTRNTANFNDYLGIEALSGVIDGGGNSAIGNGNSLQCTNVVC